MLRQNRAEINLRVFLSNTEDNNGKLREIEMCSSPKSSGSSRPRRAPIKSIAERLTSEQRARFTLVANRAQERRDQRQAINKRWEQRNLDNCQQKARAINSTSNSSPIIAWFAKLYFAIR